MWVDGERPESAFDEQNSMYCLHAYGCVGWAPAGGRGGGSAGSRWNLQRHRQKIVITKFIMPRITVPNRT